MHTLAIFLKWARGLNGRHDRIAQVTFRGKPYLTDVYEFCYDAEWEKEFDWPIDDELKLDDFVLIEIFNRNRPFPRRKVGMFQVFLKNLLNKPWLEITDNLVDLNNTVLNAVISFELMYVREIPRITKFNFFHQPEEKVSLFEDSEHVDKNISEKSDFELNMGMKRKQSVKDINDNEETDKLKPHYNSHPKVRIETRHQRKDVHVKVTVNVIEAKHLSGTKSDVTCSVVCFGETKSTESKSQTNNPYWDELFHFETVNQMDLVFDEILHFKVYSNNGSFSLTQTVLGSFKIDLGTVYSQHNHRFIRKFACLTHPDEAVSAITTGIKGYLKLNITVLLDRETAKELPSISDNDNDIDANPLIPEGWKVERKLSSLCVRVFKAEHIPSMSSGVMSNLTKQFTGELNMRDLVDPFVQVSFAGLEARTSVQHNCYNPKWNEEIVFYELFPSLCRRIKIQLKDKDILREEVIGTLWIDLSDISNNDFLPTFGPSWLNLYGSSRDYHFIKQNAFYNQGLEEGIDYRGRILLSIHLEESELTKETKNVYVRPFHNNSHAVGGIKKEFQLFCCIYEACMIDGKTASKPIQFEINIGNYGNRADESILSFINQQQVKSDKLNLPLTTAMTAESLDEEYYNMPYYEHKPCLHIQFTLEDHIRRLYLQNILHRFIINLEDALKETQDRFQINASDRWEYLRDALDEIVGNCIKLSTQLQKEQKDTKAASKRLKVTQLDEERLCMCISYTSWVIDEANEIRDSLIDNEHIGSKYRTVKSFISQYKKLMNEPQQAFPDIIIWLLSGSKQICYTRIPAHKLVYSPVEYKSGIDSGEVQTYMMYLPSTSSHRIKDSAIKCKLTCLLWLGTSDLKHNILLHAPKGYTHLNLTYPLPSELHYSIVQNFTLRAHIYQARELIGMDDTGVSDAFSRVMLNNHAGDTNIIQQTRCPTWNQTILFQNLKFYGDIEFVLSNPPIIIVELFDYDSEVKIKFIGRTFCRPIVKRASDPYEKPFFPPKLEWFPIHRGNNSAGELLAAFELLQTTMNNKENLPPELIEAKDGGYFTIPMNITPVMTKYWIEYLFWGVREIKTNSLGRFENLQVCIQCSGNNVESDLISAHINLNFSKKSYGRFCLELPEEEVYCPPLTILVNKVIKLYKVKKIFGSTVIKSLLNFIQDSSAFSEYEENEVGINPDVEKIDEVSNKKSPKNKVGSIKKNSSVRDKKSVIENSFLESALTFSKKTLGDTKSYTRLENPKFFTNYANRNSLSKEVSFKNQSSQISFHIVPKSNFSDRISSKTYMMNQINLPHTPKFDYIGNKNEDFQNSNITPFNQLINRSTIPVEILVDYSSDVTDLTEKQKSEANIKLEEYSKVNEYEENLKFQEDDKEKVNDGIKVDEQMTDKQLLSVNNIEKKVKEILAADVKSKDENKDMKIEEIEKRTFSKEIIIPLPYPKIEVSTGKENKDLEEAILVEEDQIDWWSRFYESLKYIQRIQAKVIETMKNSKTKNNEVILEMEHEKEFLGSDMMKMGNPKIVRLKIYDTELEKIKDFDQFCDVFQSWNLYTGKSDGNDDDDERRICGKFKGVIKVWKDPLPPYVKNNVKTGSFRHLPRRDRFNVLCRVYIVQAMGLRAMDISGKSDPYIRIQVGNKIISDREKYIPKELNPIFGRVFDCEVTFPQDNMLIVSVFDYDVASFGDDLIGETKIDIENRFFSRHRATCGISLQYHMNGMNKWRDPIKPTAILQHLCETLNLPGPEYTPGKCKVGNLVACGHEQIIDDNGKYRQSNEPSALCALHNFSAIDKTKCFSLVPEHVETRSLYNPEKPGETQGKVMLWVDLFSMDGPSPGPAIDIAPRVPIAYELRCIIWNTEDVERTEFNILFGQYTADIYVKGWIEGLQKSSQSTDVHYASLTGEGNFNWRFIFPFKFYKAEEKIAIIKKASLFSWVDCEEKVLPRLILQCWDSDIVFKDDHIGDLTLNLTSIPRPSKTSMLCDAKIMENEDTKSIFRKKKMKGWWPFIKIGKVVGKVEMELTLLTEQESTDDPAGLGREEPSGLLFPNRPDLMMNWLILPIRTLRYALWDSYKFKIAKAVFMFILLAVLSLFLYYMPSSIVKKIVG
ncbi:otoferlin isoform X2 [Hydra vulgaris]|uniref:otoferlin isoform X2 n=2 Tax=Hydra vulgaris TaxID=6087 RepID=UPI001F5F9536|nr:otoferlin-like isoform X2 [Hydra vulgaris]